MAKSADHVMEIDAGHMAMVSAPAGLISLPTSPLVVEARRP
jgi:hypothetical protein